MAAASAAGLPVGRADSTQEGAIESPEQKPADYPRLLVLFQGLCAYVANPRQESPRKLDVGLLNTAQLADAEEHVSTLAIHRSTIKSMVGVRPVATDLDYAFFNLRDKRIRFTPQGDSDRSLILHHGAPPSGECPANREDWADLRWLLAFKGGLDWSNIASLHRDWRKRTDAIDALVELRHGTLEGSTVTDINIPGNEDAQKFWDPHTQTKRALKETVRLSITAAVVNVDIWPLTSSSLEGRIEIGVAGDDQFVRVTQLPSTYAPDHSSMPDLAAFWLLTDKDEWSLNASDAEKNLPTRLHEDCDLSSTDGCLCCPGVYFEETRWGGRK